MMGYNFDGSPQQTRTEEEPDISEAEDDLSVGTSSPKKVENVAAINSLKNYKAPGKEQPKRKHKCTCKHIHSKVKRGFVCHLGR